MDNCIYTYISKMTGKNTSTSFCVWTAQISITCLCLHSYTSGLEISCGVQEERRVD